LNALDLPAIGPAIEAHELFPNRTNVSWYTVLPHPRTADDGEHPESHTQRAHGGQTDDPTADGEGVIRARIFERGVGETLSSGTGATGAAIAYRLSGGPAQVTVLLDGGELRVEIGEDLQVNLTGWARPVFEGRISDDFLEELHETE
jgi:diaminopimelate epimerase